MKVVNQAKDSSTGNIVAWVTDAPDPAGDAYPGPGNPSEVAIAGYLNDAFPKRFAKSTIANGGSADFDLALAENRFSQVTAHVVCGNGGDTVEQAISVAAGFANPSGVAALSGDTTGYDFDPGSVGLALTWSATGGSARLNVANSSGANKDVLVLLGVQDFEIPQ